MINLPKIIDTYDIMFQEDTEGIDKIASRITEEIDLTTEINNLPNEKFAAVIRNGDDVLRKFPIDTKTSTELSIIALEHTNKNLPDEIVKTAAANLLKAAYLWDIDASSIKTLAGSGIRTNYVTKMDEEKYLEKISHPEVFEHKVFALNDKYPIDTPSLLKSAEEYFSKYAHLMDVVDQYEYSKNIIKQASTLNYKITCPGIAKYASLRHEVNPDLVSILKARDRWGDTDGIYTKIASMVNSVPLEKLAEAILEADEVTGMNQYYGSKIPDPIFTVFASLEKRSEKKFTKKALHAISNEKLQAVGLTEDAIRELKGPKGEDVLNSLPDPIMTQIIDMM